jgi:Uma2 family endonuclease
MRLNLAEEYLPATITFPVLTDAEFLALAAEHEDLTFETTAEGELVVAPPAGPDSGSRSFSFASLVAPWAKGDGRGICFDSSTIFVLPNGSRRSPDFAWILKGTVAELRKKSPGSLWRVAPDFVVEIRSESDRISRLQVKMQEYLDNGVTLGWLIDPLQRRVWIYRPNLVPELLKSPTLLQGEAPVEGLIVPLDTVWDPYS